VTFGELQDATFATASEATRTSYPPERRLTAAQLDAVLSSGRYAIVSTTRADGRPHAAPTSFSVVDGVLWLPTVAGSVRARNVTRQPWAVLVVAEGVGETHLAVVVEGPVTVSAEPPGGLPRPEWAAEWLALRPERVLSYAAAGWTG
jgi:hypothetical protein